MRKILCVLFAVIVSLLLLSACASGGDETGTVRETDDSSATLKETEETENTEESKESSASESEKNDAMFIADFLVSEKTMFVGETLDFSTGISPSGTTTDDLTFEVSDPDVISVSEKRIAAEGEKAILSFRCTAMKAGDATLAVRFTSAGISSGTVSFHVDIPPVISKIGKIDPLDVTQEVDEVQTVFVMMKPGDLTQNDFSIVNSDENIVRVSDVFLENGEENTLLSFHVTGTGVGKATVRIVGADGKTESEEIRFTVNEKDTSRVVYITPTGKKYHLSASCAGKNAIPTTEKKATASGYGICLRCGDKDKTAE